MLRRACLLVNYNLYESKRHFTQQLAAAMERKGIKTKIVDVKEEKLETEKAAEIQRFSPDFTCSFNSFSPLPDKKFLWDILQIPHLSILVDPAIYSVQLTDSPYSIISCVDRSDCAAIKGRNFHPVFFWPHAIESSIVAPEGPRPYDVVFLGSCYDYQNIQSYWQAKYPPEVVNALHHASDLLLSDKHLSLAESFAEAWNTSGLYKYLEWYLRDLVYFVDTYSRGVDRIELIRQIKDAEVHVFGDLMEDQTFCKLGWKEYLVDKPNVHIHPAVSYQDSLEILKQSKICLNSSPFFGNGSHERVFAGLACGTLPLTDSNLYWKEVFTEGEEILFYEHQRREQANEFVKDILKNEAKRKAMVTRGREKVMKQHTWDKRVEELQEILPQILEKITNTWVP